jgi:hypothetical protein
MVQPGLPGLSGGVYTLTKIRGGAYSPWTDGVDAFVTKMKALYHTADSIDSAELFELSSPSAAPVVVASYPIGIAGTNDGADQPLGEAVLTYRCLPKSILKQYFMEAVGSTDFHLTYGELDAHTQAMITWMLSSDSYVFARNEGVPQNFLFWSSKTSDALRKKYVLNA